MSLKCYRCGFWDGEKCHCNDGQTLFHGDCKEVLPLLPKYSLVIADPPYGDTSLGWDKIDTEWIKCVDCLQLWCFGSFRFFMRSDFEGWKLAQEIVWEKHNGSGFHADRFRRVHELAVHFYRGAWEQLTRNVQFTNDATKRTVRRKQRPAHTGNIDEGHYESHDGGPRMMRSVIQARSCHGKAIHPTQKPEKIVAPLVLFSSNESDLIVDPFAGSGTTLSVCRQFNRRGIGIEIDEHWCSEIVKRLRQRELFHNNI